MVPPQDRVLHCHGNSSFRGGTTLTATADVVLNTDVRRKLPYDRTPDLKNQQRKSCRLALDSFSDVTIATPGGCDILLGAQTMRDMQVSLDAHMHQRDLPLQLMISALPPEDSAALSDSLKPTPSTTSNTTRSSIPTSIPTLRLRSHQLYSMR